MASHNVNFGAVPEPKKMITAFKSFDSYDFCAIPDQFMKHFETGFPQAVYLRNSQFFTWSVDVKKIDGHYFFTKGWSNFVCDNWINEGFLMVFVYGLHELFDVQLFACEMCLDKGLTFGEFPMFVLVKQNLDNVDLGNTNIVPMQVGKATDCGVKFSGDRFVVVYADHHHGAMSPVTANNTEADNINVIDVDSIVDDRDEVMLHYEKPYTFNGHLSNNADVNDLRGFKSYSVEISRDHIIKPRLPVPTMFWRSIAKGLSYTPKTVKLSLDSRIWSVRVRCEGTRVMMRGDDLNDFIFENDLFVGSKLTFFLVDKDDLLFEVKVQD